MPDIRELLRARPYMFALLLAVFLAIVNLIADPTWGKPSGWPEELATVAPFVLLAMASTPAIVSGGGGLDISVGPLAVVINTMLVVWFLPHSGLSSPLVAIPLLLLIGAAVGAINGLLITVLRFEPVIATLCAFFILSGVALTIASEPVGIEGAQWLKDLGNQVGPIPGALLLMGFPCAVWYALSRTTFHDALYAVGGNDATAYSSGVDIGKARVIAYALGGLFAATAGIALSAVLLAANANNVALYSLVALAAVALGGTPLGGGRGGLVGSIMGAACIYELQTLLGALDVSATWNQVVYATLLIVGVIVGALLQRAKPGGSESAA